MGKNKKPVIVGLIIMLFFIVSGGMLFLNFPSIRLQRAMSLGNKYLEDLEYDKAIVAFREAIDIDPKCLEAYEGALTAYQELGDEEELLNFYEKTIDTLEYYAEEFTGEELQAVVSIYKEAKDIYKEDKESYIKVLEQAYVVTGEDEEIKEELEETYLELEEEEAEEEASEEKVSDKKKEREEEKAAQQRDENAVDKGNETKEKGGDDKEVENINSPNVENETNNDEVNGEEDKAKDSLDEEKKSLEEGSYPAEMNIPAESLEWNNHYYACFDHCSTWEEAVSFCESLGGHLATISSAEENSAVFDYLLSCGYESGYFGYTDNMEEGSWYWTTGEVSDFINWHKGEPNGQNAGEDYAMFYYKFKEGTWNDGDFSGKAIFICEWD